MRQSIIASRRMERERREEMDPSTQLSPDHRSIYTHRAHTRPRTPKKKEEEDPYEKPRKDLQKGSKLNEASEDNLISGKRGWGPGYQKGQKKNPKKGGGGKEPTSVLFLTANSQAAAHLAGWVFAECPRLLPPASYWLTGPYANPTTASRHFQGHHWLS